MLATLNDLLNKLPFEPFRIVTSSGDKYEVQNPHNIAIMESRIFYAFPRSDQWAFVRLNQITAYESCSNKTA